MMAAAVTVTSAKMSFMSFVLAVVFIIKSLIFFRNICASGSSVTYCNKY